MLRYAPGGMKKENSGSKLTPDNAFSLDRSAENHNLEKGLVRLLDLIVINSFR